MALAGQGPARSYTDRLPLASGGVCVDGDGDRCVDEDEDGEGDGGLSVPAGEGFNVPAAEGSNGDGACRRTPGASPWASAEGDGERSRSRGDKAPLARGDALNGEMTSRAFCDVRCDGVGVGVVLEVSWTCDCACTLQPDADADLFSKSTTRA